MQGRGATRKNNVSVCWTRWVKAGRLGGQQAGPLKHEPTTLISTQNNSVITSALSIQAADKGDRECFCVSPSEA